MLFPTQAPGPTADKPSMTLSSPIGIFDSGIGGLSVARAVRERLPSESILYVADSCHAPYGDKSDTFIRERMHVITDFLLAQGRQGRCGGLQYGYHRGHRPVTCEFFGADYRRGAGGQTCCRGDPQRRGGGAGDPAHPANPFL